MSPFELQWADLSKRRMSPPGIAERLDVIENVGACRIAFRVGLPAHAFLLERGKETLDGGIVPAVAAPAHAAGDAFGGEQALKVLAGVLPGLNWSSQHRLDAQSVAPHSTPRLAYAS